MHSPDSEDKRNKRQLPRGPASVAPSVVGYTLTLDIGEINHHALVIDTETTGRSITAEIIEVAVCDIEGRLLYERLVRPTASVPRAAARIHGLTTEQLTNALTWDQVWIELEPLLRGRALIAFNASFDRRMVEMECARYRFPPPCLRWRCAMRFVKERLRLRRAPTLTEACLHFQITPGTHRAATDARATAQLLQRVINNPK